MKIHVLAKLWQEQGYEVASQYGNHRLFRPALGQSGPYLMAPLRAPANVPIGILQTTLRPAPKGPIQPNWVSTLLQTPTLTIILEKQGTYVWGRIDVPGLVAVTCGPSADDVTRSFQRLLPEFAQSGGSSVGSTWTDKLTFVYAHDVTAIGELFKQVKVNQLAGLAGIDWEQMNQYMTGRSHPDTNQAKQLEAGLRELGQQLLQFELV